MSTFVTLPRCLLSSPLSYGPCLLSIGTGGGGEQKEKGFNSVAIFAWPPFPSFMYSHVPCDHMKNFLGFSQGQAFLCSAFLWFLSSHLCPPPPPPLRKVARAQYKQSFCFYQDKLSSAWVLPLGVQFSLGSFLTCAVTPSHHHHGVAALSSVRELSI